MGGKCDTYSAERGTYRVVIGKPEEKETTQKSQASWKGTIHMNVQEIGSGA